MKTILVAATLMAAFVGDAGASECTSMQSVAAIPRDWHPVTVQWYGDGRPDLVCIEKNGGRQMQVSHWQGFETPSGYRIVQTDHSLNITFRGCAQFSTWQGVNNCMTSWPTSVVVRTR